MGCYKEVYKLIRCPNCNSSNVKATTNSSWYEYYCKDCKHEFMGW